MSGLRDIPDETYREAEDGMLDHGALTEDRPLRADADRNRRAILVAAERLFAERGFEVPLADIAAAAGVGRATLHRNFATRSDLAFALFERDMQDIRELAARQKGEVRDFEDLLDLKLRCYIRNGGLAEAVQRQQLTKDFAQERAEVAVILHRAAQPAIAAGILRPDLTVGSFLILQMAIGGVMLGGGGPADRVMRAAEVKSLLLDGLKRGR
jgi:AcrR family transcriptional regulator